MSSSTRQRRQTRMKQRCSTSIRHWFTQHGDVGSRTAVCRHACGAVHPSIRDAMKLARYYHNLYSLPEEASAADIAAHDRNGRLIDEAIERLGNEVYAE